MGWQGWAAEAIGPRIGAIPTWTDFWATNGAMIVFGASAAIVVFSAPGFGLGFAALCLINALFFHVLPSIQAGRPNPGLFTAILLYIPIGIWAYVAAEDFALLSTGTVVLSIAVGAAAMAFALLALVLGSRLGYADVDPASLEEASSSTSSAPR